MVGRAEKIRIGVGHRDGEAGHVLYPPDENTARALTLHLGWSPHLARFKG